MAATVSQEGPSSNKLSSIVKEFFEKPLSGSVVVEALATMPAMEVTSQGSVAHEYYAKSGVQKQVHVVVKNTVFMVDLASTVDLIKCNSLETKLLYDFDREEDETREVSYVRNEPLDYKVNLHDGGYRATVELKIKVLTSQHEDMLFRVRFSATDPATQMDFSTTTQPIKVISKLTQISKKKDFLQMQESPPVGLIPQHSQIQQILLQKKRGNLPNEVILSSLNRLEQRLEQNQQEHKAFQSMILHKLFIDPNLPLNSSLTSMVNSEALQTLSNIISQQQQQPQQQQEQQQQQKLQHSQTSQNASEQEEFTGGSESPIIAPTIENIINRQHQIPSQQSQRNRSSQSSSESGISEFTNTTLREVDSTTENALEEYGYRFISAIGSLPSEERRERIVSFLHSIHSDVIDRIAEFCDIFYSLQRSSIDNNNPNPRYSRDNQSDIAGVGSSTTSKKRARRPGDSL